MRLRLVGGRRPPAVILSEHAALWLDSCSGTAIFFLYPFVARRSRLDTLVVVARVNVFVSVHKFCGHATRRFGLSILLQVMFQHFHFFAR